MCFRYSFFQEEKRVGRGLSCSCHFHMLHLLGKGGWAPGAGDSTQQQRQGWPRAPPANISSPIVVSYLPQGALAQSTSLAPASRPLGWLWPLGPCGLVAGWRLQESREQVPAQQRNKCEVWAVPLAACENIKKEKRCHQEQCYVMHSGK